MVELIVEPDVFGESVWIEFGAWGSGKDLNLLWYQIWCTSRGSKLVLKLRVKLTNQR